MITQEKFIVELDIIMTPRMKIEATRMTEDIIWFFGKYHQLTAS